MMTFTRTTLALALGALIVGSLAVAADPASTPGAVRSKKTGYDLKAVDIGTTGSPSYFPIFTFANVGKKATTTPVRFVMRFQGQDSKWGEVPPLAAGQKNVQTMSGSWGGFARYGLELEVFVDCEDVIEEDDELNNVYKETLRDPRRIQRTAIPHP